MLGKYATEFKKLDGQECELQGLAYESVELGARLPHQLSVDAYGELMKGLGRPWSGTETAAARPCENVYETTSKKRRV